MPACDYLVQYGRGASLGRFRGVDGDNLRRGDEIVIQSLRGLELGTVLCPASAHGPSLPDPFIGEVHRRLTDVDRNSVRNAAAQAQRVLEAAGRLASERGLPLLIIDAEPFLDQRTVILHAIATGLCDASPLLDDLAERFGVIVRLYDLGLSEPLPADAPDHNEPITCGKENCGQGDCSTCGDESSGCTSCSAGSAKELNEYFSELRSEMEKGRVPLA